VHTKQLQGCQLFIFQQSSHNIYVPAQWVFIEETSYWVRFEGIFTSKNKKIKNHEWLEMGLLKKWHFWKTKRITNKTLYRTFAQSRFPHPEHFYLWKLAASEIFLSFLVRKQKSSRWQGKRLWVKVWYIVVVCLWLF
jgi:hypothetical protein